MVLLLPYYELNTSKNITSLDELFINSNSKWLDKCDIYEWDEGIFDASWFDKPKLKLKKEVKVEDLKE